MKASQWLQDVPQGRTPDREGMILNAVRAGAYVLEWAPLTIEAGGMLAQYSVASRPLRIGEPGDAVTINCGHRTAQLLCDEIDAVLPTAMLADQMWAQADLKLAPILRSYWMDDGTASLTHRMVEYSGEIDKAIGGRRFILLGNGGKHWINTSGLGTPTVPKLVNIGGRWVAAACNYGWYGGGASQARTLPGVRVWQGPGYKHDLGHTDYSQVLQPVQRHVWVCRAAMVPISGVEPSGVGYAPPPALGAEGTVCQLPGGAIGSWEKYDIYELVRRPDLRALLTEEPHLVYMRHPAVPWAAACARMSFVGPPGGGGGVCPPHDPGSDEPLSCGPGTPDGADWRRVEVKRIALSLGLALGGAAAGWYGVRGVKWLARRGLVGA